MNKYILFFSEKCKYCQQFLNQLKQTKFYNLFVRISIHDSQIKLPPKLKTVPTIIVPTLQKPLEGNEVFSWLQQQQPQRQQHTQQQQPQRQQYTQQQPQRKSVSFTNSQPQRPKRQVSKRPDFTKPIESQQLEENEPSPFLLEMNSSLSDSFSYIDNETPLSHNYSFIQDKNDIQQNIQQTQQTSEMDRYLNSRDNDPYIGKAIART